MDLVKVVEYSTLSSTTSRIPTPKIPQNRPNTTKNTVILLVQARENTTSVVFARLRYGTRVDRVVSYGVLMSIYRPIPSRLSQNWGCPPSF